ncbi:hypothetical protein WJX73_003101 [Symbiochloris irregularis]|uniref:Cilia- and flagella-associated protein 299 n=1 Tax=Symbiochloris irregularis TaxID=706552 RepID=A0AAW1NY71_9CHLO
MTEVAVGLDSNGRASISQTYEDFLDGKVTSADLFYLDDAETARQLAQMRLPKTGGHATRADFDATQLRAARTSGDTAKAGLASEGCNLSKSPLLQELASREEAVRSGRLATIIFIRDFKKGGQEVSGYIDYGHRLKSVEASMAAVFAGRERLLPRPSDLSYYNWTTHLLSSQASTFFEVQEDNPAGLFFKHRQDRKIISVDTAQASDESCHRIVLEDPGYQQAILFDHEVRRR